MMRKVRRKVQRILALALSFALLAAGIPLDAAAAEPLGIETVSADGDEEEPKASEESEVIAGEPEASEESEELPEEEDEPESPAEDMTELPAGEDESESSFEAGEALPETGEESEAPEEPESSEEEAPEKEEESESPAEDSAEFPAGEDESEGSFENEEALPEDGENEEASLEETKEEEPESSGEETEEEEPEAPEEETEEEESESSAEESESPAEASTELSAADQEETGSLDMFLTDAEETQEALAEEDEAEKITVSGEFNPFEWDAYEESMFALFSMAGYEGSYGSELYAEQKEIYDKLEDYYLDEDANFSNGTTDALIFTLSEELTGETTEELYEYLDYAYWAFVYDHPEAFWAGSVLRGFGPGMDEDGIYHMQYVKFDIYEKYDGAKAELDAYRSGVESSVNTIRANAAAESREQLLEVIHDYLCSRLSYNYSAVSSANADNAAYLYAYSNGAVFTGRSSVVCQGYAEAFKVLSDQFGIPCAEIVGTAGGGAHMWNYVQMEDSNWYAVDCTWDDQSTVSYTYFLCGRDSAGFNDTFGNEHVEKPCFTKNENITFIYPALSGEAFARSGTEACIHADSEWRTVKEPDCITEGIMQKVCKVCGKVTDTNTIPATMNLEDGCTLNIAQTTWTYTGNAIQPKITLSCNGQTVSEACYAVTFANHIAAGTGKVTVTGRNGYQGTLTGSFTIKKADSSVRLTGVTAVYSGSAIEIPAAGCYGSSGAVTYTYYTNAACTVKTSSANGAASVGAAPKNAGTYYVRASLAGDANYNGAVSSSVKLVIEKASAAVKLTSKTVSYNGKAASIGAASVSNNPNTVTYIYYTDSTCKNKTTKANSGAVSVGAAPKNAGTYYVRASVTEDSNHTGAVSNTAKLVIKKSSPTVRLKAKTAVYTGKAIAVGKATVTGSAGTVTYTYYTDAKCTKKTSKSKDGASSAGKAPKNVGTYYVRAKAAANTNCSAATSNIVKLVIKKATPTVKLTAKAADYTGKAISIGKATVTGGAGTVTYTYYTDAKCTKKTSKSKHGASGAGKAPKYAGIYYVRASVAANANYKSAKSNAVRLTIRPGKASLTSVKNTAGKKITVKWPKKTGIGMATGNKYVIEYSTDKKFKTGVKRVTVSGTKTSCTISKLKKGKTYYVRIKAYSVKQKVYGKVSGVKTVKITK